MKLPCPRATNLLIIIGSNNRHATRPQNRPAHEAHLQQGSTNPEYKSTQQDLTETKLIELRHAGLGIQGMALAIIKVLLRKSFLTKCFISTFETS